MVYLALDLFSNNKSFALNVDSKSEVWHLVVDLCFYTIILTVLKSCAQEREKQIAQPLQ